MNDGYIFVIFQPFALKQKIYVYDDNGNQINYLESTIDNLIGDIFSFISGYDIEKIELMGPIQFSRGVAKKIKNEEMIKYNENKIKIECFT